MKKLMTVIASVALAFGLYAADSDFKFNKTDFSAPKLDLGPLDLTKNDAGGNTAPFYWAGEVGDSEIKEAEDATKFLAIENSAPLYRTVNNAPDAKTQKIGTGVFADMYVKFTASDAADPVVLADGSKLGIWVAADDEAETPTTNLMVRAASLAGGDETPVAADFVLDVGDDFDFTAEHRVTIRAIEEISGDDNKMAGFLIYLDGVDGVNKAPVAAADAADYAEKMGEYKFSAVAQPFATANQLFPSLIEAGTDDAQTIYGVGFKGTGELTQIALTDADNAPSFAKPAVDVTFEWADGVESFTYQGIATNVGGKAGSVVVTLAGPTVPVTLSGVTASDGYVLGDIEAKGLDEVEDGVWSYKDASASLTMTAGEVAFTIGDKKYATFEDALAAAENGDTIKFAKSMDSVADKFVIEGKEVVIDLAGKSITAPSYQESELFYAGSGASLTIIDSVGGSKVTVVAADDQYYGLFFADGGNIQVGLDEADKGVTYDSLVGEAGTLTILKGLFLASDNTKAELEFYLPEGDEYEVVEAGAYWEVQKKSGPEPIFVIEIVGGDKYETIDAALADAKDGQTLQLLDDVTLTATVAIDKAITFDLNKKTVTFADGTYGDGAFQVTANATIKNGKIADELTALVAACGINIVDADGTLQDLVVDTTHFKWGVGGEGSDWQNNDPTYTITCKNVAVTGGRSLFVAEGINMTLDADCSAIQSGEDTQDWRNCAIHAGANAVVTIAGGEYTGKYAIYKMSSPAKIYVNGGKFTGGVYMHEIDPVYEGTGDDVLAIAAGDFSDDEIDVKYLANTVDAGYEKAWVAGDEVGYVKPGAKAITYNITYTFEGVEDADKAKIVNNNPATFTVEDEDIVFVDASCEGYEFTGFVPTQIEKGSTGDKEITGTFKKQGGGYPPEWPKTDEDTKAKFAAWVAGKGAGADLSTDDAKDAFLLNCAVKDLKDAKDAFKITSIEFVEGEWVIGEPEGDFNGKVVTKAFDAVVDGREVTEPTGEETELFWKAFLVFPPAAE